MNEDLRTLLTNPECFPVELTLTSGDKITIEHPDFVHFAGRLNRIFYFPPESGAIFEMLLPEQIAKVRAKVKKSAAWLHFFKGSS